MVATPWRLNGWIQRSNHDLETLQAMVVDAFAAVPVRCAARPSHPYTDQPRMNVGDNSCPTTATATTTAATNAPSYAASALKAVKALGNGITAEVAAAYALGFVAGASTAVVPSPQAAPVPVATERTGKVQPSAKLLQPPLYHAHHASAAGGGAHSNPVFESPFNPALFKRVCYMLPIENNHRIAFTWCLPPQYNTPSVYRKDMAAFVTEILGDEGPGSVLDLLRARGLAIELQCSSDGNGVYDNRDVTLWECTVLLTSAGVADWAAVACLVFEGLALLRDVAGNRPAELEQLYTEHSLLARQQFDYKAEDSVFEFVENTASRMLKYARPDILNEGGVFEAFDLPRLQDILAALTSEACHVCVVSSTVADKCKDTEFWFGTSYSFEDVPAALRRRWVAADACCTASELHIRPPNKFISANMSLKPYAGDSARATAATATATDDDTLPFRGYQPGKVPAKRHRKVNYELWHLHDISFKVPKVQWHFLISSPALTTDSGAGVLGTMFVNMFEQLNGDIIYPASLAGINTHIAACRSGLFLVIDGFNDAISNYCQELFHRIAVFADGMPAATFTTVKDRLHDEYTNDRLDPDNLTATAVLAVLQPSCWYTVVAEKIAFLGDVILDDLVQYGKTLFAKVALKAMVVGNETIADATAMMDMVSNALGSPPTCAQAEIDLQVPLQLTELDRKMTVAPTSASASTTIRVPVLVQRNCNPDDSNGVINNTYQFDCVKGPLETAYADHALTSCAAKLLVQVLETQMFDQLRTKEQLGYTVDCYRSRKGSYGQLHFCIDIKYDSQKHTAEHVQSRVDAFLTGSFPAFLKDMSPETFEEHKQSMVEGFRCPFENLEEMTEAMWVETCFVGCEVLNPNTTPWNTDAVIADTQLTQAFVADFFDTWIAPSGAKTRKVCCWTLGKDESAPEPDRIADKALHIVDAQSYRSLHP